MWLVEEEEQGYFRYCLYKNKPIMEETFPTERTCCVECINYEEAEYICDIPEDVIERLPFIVNSDPIEITVKLGDELYREDTEKGKPYIKLDFNRKMLEGRTIKDVFIYNGPYSNSSSHILIVFDDYTYTIIGLTDTDDDMVKIDSKYEYFLTEKGQKEYKENPLKFGYVNNDGIYCIEPRYKDYIDAGIINIPDEVINTAVVQRQKQIDECEYQQYLKLKEKYEGKGIN